jgi:hypothetical protein
LPLWSIITQKLSSVHDTDDSGPGASIGVADQVTGGVTALAVAYTLPSLATATHRAVALHDTAVRALVLVSRVARHDRALVGFVDTRTLPALSTAAHSEAVGQETAVTSLEPSTSIESHDDGALVGFVDTRTLPASSTATHSEADGHESPFSWRPGAMFPGAHIELVGAVLEKTLAASSTAKHSAADRQESAVRWLERSVDTVPLHGAFSGAVIERTLAPLPTATHSEPDWQVSAVSAWLEESDWTGGAHVNGAAACAAPAPIPAPPRAIAKAKTVRRACRPMLVLLIVITVTSQFPR